MTLEQNLKSIIVILTEVCDKTNYLEIANIWFSTKVCEIYIYIYGKYSTLNKLSIIIEYNSLAYWYYVSYQWKEN
jgi:hypothetical protein